MTVRMLVMVRLMIDGSSELTSYDALAAFSTW